MILKDSEVVDLNNLIEKPKKKRTLRNNEYYHMQDTFDRLYQQSKDNKKFSSLMRIITSKENILLSYRNIKHNKGSKTTGVNKTNIANLAETKPDEFVRYIQNRLNNFVPHEIKRVEIPKPNGKTRPLGIPTIEDRLIQQCIKQVLEPICEAKFHEHSYGFRPNRSTHHAIARTYKLINLNRLHYVVNVDIKGFFDNVNHGKLLKQLWSMGIRDKSVLKVISKMLKAPIKGIGIQDKGTPQGGILSPLLSNIVLNEFDWWISSQWETFITKREYCKTINPHNGRVSAEGRYRAMKTTKLKEMFMVRYADDFQIFCKDYETAQVIFKAVKLWLNERLGLEISPEKSKVINLRKNSMDFLGFTLKVHKKGNKRVCQSRVCNKAFAKIKEQVRIRIKEIKSKQTNELIYNFNAYILGTHEYYKVATFGYMDFNKIGYQVRKYIHNQLKGIAKNRGEPSKTFQKLYGHSKEKRYFINGIALYPIRAFKMNKPMNFSQTICDYTESGRKKIHQAIKMNTLIIKYLLENPIKGETTEYNDNRISLYVGQNGKCSVTGDFLEIGRMHCHHKTPRSVGGDDRYNNLTFVKVEVHKLIHATKPETIKKFLNDLKLSEEHLKKLNRLRKKVGNEIILVN
ncbi:group II intron reverse transcriptase/maturase [Bacillus altitudinis]|uniref:group II intron reverse transcriptase/maturase n=1 Tax=Bacillus altitudinis TaxID=293387 RepID=UPI0024A948C3|nr:group II intron reverse transcriptase/maturase [Bacillus altitudinis]WHF27556.1 group II intron reverse transcriptase/maturase [Bacillus altitudinis]WHF28872.1 group II intron reverse transcriptase/maturase [Bacillus altitudinis]